MIKWLFHPSFRREIINLLWEVKKIYLDYGNLLIDLSQIVPDGIICFFPSYRYMEEVILNWNEMGILEQILENKLIYIESKDTLATS